jgi:hypothetical protein
MMISQEFHTVNNNTTLRTTSLTRQRLQTHRRTERRTCKCEKMTLMGNVITFLTRLGGILEMFLSAFNCL